MFLVVCLVLDMTGYNKTKVLCKLLQFNSTLWISISGGWIANWIKVWNCGLLISQNILTYVTHPIAAFSSLPQFSTSSMALISLRYSFSKKYNFCSYYKNKTSIHKTWKTLKKKKFQIIHKPWNYKYCWWC